MPRKRPAETETADVDAKNGSPAAKKGHAQPVPDTQPAGFQWSDADDMHVYESAGVQPSSTVLALDMDWTVIKTKSGNVFPKDTSDWTYLYAEVPGKLAEMHKQGYKVVVFTNQKGLKTGKVKLPDFKKKVQAIFEKITAPVQVFVSPGEPRAQKPYTGMWQYFESRCNGGVQVDRARSLFVGDAAGRPATKTRKKDFANSDRLFALNLGIPFQTPEEFFLGHKAQPHSMPEFDPKSVFENRTLLEPASAKLTSDEPEVIVMVGAPASGKSEFVKAKLVPKGYEWVNQDTLKTWQKCVAATKAALASGKSVVVDNTNGGKEARKRYTDVAAAAKVPCRCFKMNVTKPHAFHNNKFRLITGPDKAHQSVNEMVMNTYFSRYQEPSVDEGFSEIVTVNFIPDFEDSDDRNVYSMYLLDK